MAIFRKTLDKLKKGLGKTRETFVASLRSVLSGRQLDDDLIREIEKRLIQSDVGVKATKILIDGIKADYKAGTLTKGEDVIEYLKRELKAMWPKQDRALCFADTGPTVILVTGVNGVGKTTSISKLCKQLKDDGHSVLLGACDTFRAGAVRQLEIWSERLGVEVVKGQQGGDPAAVAFDACSAAVSRNIDPAILETHQNLGTFTAFALAAWGALRAYAWWRKIDLSANRAYLVLAVEVAFVFLILTVAYFGGQLVYDFGVNVAPVFAKP